MNNSHKELRPKHLPADKRRSLTVATVIELAAEQNPSEITTSAIAHRMNLTQGELFRHFPTTAATLFIGSVQGLVMQSLLAGNVRRIRSDAPGAFAIFARGIRREP